MGNIKKADKAYQAFITADPCSPRYFSLVSKTHAVLKNALSHVQKYDPKMKDFTPETKKLAKEWWRVRTEYDKLRLIEPTLEKPTKKVENIDEQRRFLCGSLKVMYGIRGTLSTEGMRELERLDNGEEGTLNSDELNLYDSSCILYYSFHSRIDAPPNEIKNVTENIKDAISKMPEGSNAHIDLSRKFHKLEMKYLDGTISEEKARLSGENMLLPIIEEMVLKSIKEAEEKKASSAQQLSHLGNSN